MIKAFLFIAVITATSGEQTTYVIHDSATETECLALLLDYYQAHNDNARFGCIPADHMSPFYGTH